MDNKICARCKKEKLLEEYHNSSKSLDGKQPICKECKKDYNKQYKIDNALKWNEYMIAYYKSTEERTNKRNTYAREYHNNNYFLHTYGITNEQYTEILIQQNGKCAVCLKEETAVSKEGKIKRLSVDHNHTTGIIRGLLCSGCNTGLGMLKEDIEIVESLILYIKKHNTY